MNISSAKSADYNREFEYDFAWFGDILCKVQRKQRHPTFSIFGQSLNKLEGVKDSVAGSSLFYDSDVDKSNKDDIEKIFDDKIETEEVLRTCQKIKSKE